MHDNDIFFKLTKSVTEITRQLSDSASKLQSTLSFSINESLIDSLTQTFTHYSQQIQKLQQLQYKPFIEYGICLAPSMTPNIIGVAIEKYEQGKKRAIPIVAEGLYRANNYQLLKHAVSRWNSLGFFSRRMCIFNDALEAHITGKWTLSIPSLLPQIEGIACDIYRAAINLPAKEGSVQKNIGKKKFPSTLLLESNIKEDTTRGLITTVMKDYFNKTLYAFVDFNNPKTRKILTLNRHAVLHGYRLNYATRINSLRCFLALDSMSMLAEPNKKIRP